MSTHSDIQTADDIIHSIPETAYGFRKRLQFIVNAIKRYLPERDPTSIRILDVGCGTGTLVAAPLARMGYQVHGIDRHIETITYATKQHMVPNLSFECVPLEAVEECYDVVICSEVLEHVYQPLELLQALYAHTLPDGICIVTTPNGRGPFEMAQICYKKIYAPIVEFIGDQTLRRLIWRLRGRPAAQLSFDEQSLATLNDASPHVQFFTQNRLLQLIETAGFRTLEFGQRTWLCGFIFDTFIEWNERRIQWNSTVIDRLGPAWASDWMLCLAPRGVSDHVRVDDPKSKVQQYWDAQPCGTHHVTSPYGTRAYFDEIEHTRYELEPFIHRYAGFASARGLRVLEIGCGAGTDHLQFARAGAECYGIDLTPHSARMVCQRFQLYGYHTNMHVADAERLPFADNSFDLVYSWGVLHHTPDTAEAIAELRRVLKPGGRCVVMLYHRRSLVALKLYVRHGLLAGRPWRSLAHIVYHYMESLGTKAYTTAELRSLFQLFRDVSIATQATPYDLHPLPRWLVPLVPRPLGWFLIVQAGKERNAASGDGLDG